MKKMLVMLVVLCVLALCAVALAEPNEWYDAEGRHIVIGDPIRQFDGSASMTIDVGDEGRIVIWTDDYDDGGIFKVSVYKGEELVNSGTVIASMLEYQLSYSTFWYFGDISEPVH